MKTDFITGAQDLVCKISDALKDDDRFDKANYHWYGGDSVEINLYTHKVPNYKFISGMVGRSNLNGDIDDIVDEFIDKWREDINDQSKIDSMNQFIKDITRWGTA